MGGVAAELLGMEPDARLIAKGDNKEFEGEEIEPLDPGAFALQSARLTVTGDSPSDDIRLTVTADYRSDDIRVEFCSCIPLERTDKHYLEINV